MWHDGSSVATAQRIEDSFELEVPEKCERRSRCGLAIDEKDGFGGTMGA